MFSFWKKLDSTAKYTMFLCFFSFFTNGFWNALLGSIVPDLQSYCSLNEAVSGTILSMQSVGGLIGGFVYSFLAIKAGNKRSAMFTLFVAICGILMMLIQSSSVLFVAYLLIGLGKGGLTSYSSGTVNHLSDGSSSAQNVAASCFAVGSILLPMIYLLCQRVLSWKSAVLFAAVVGIIFFFLFTRLKVKGGIQTAEKTQSNGFGFLKEAGYLILCAALFFYLCAEFAITGWLVTYLQNKSELMGAFPDEHALQAYSQMASTLLWTVILVGRLTCAWLSSRISSRSLLFISSVGVAVFFTVMIFSRSISAVTFAIVGLGLCMAGIFPLICAQAAPYMERYSMASSTLQSIGSGGGALMPMIVGFVASNQGFQGGMITILVGIILLVVFTLIHLLRQNKDALSAV